MSRSEAGRQALRRARIRLRYHGWRQGPAGQKFKGYSVREAITGKGAPKGTDAERQAMAMLVDYITGGAEIQGSMESVLDQWNDAAHQDKEMVLQAIDQTIADARPEPKRQPEAANPFRRMAASLRPQVEVSFGEEATPEPEVASRTPNFSLGQYQSPEIELGDEGEVER